MECFKRRENPIWKWDDDWGVAPMKLETSTWIFCDLLLHPDDHGWHDHVASLSLDLEAPYAGSGPLGHSELKPETENHHHPPWFDNGNSKKTR